MISDNGYNFVYLTSRTMAMSKHTKNYIKSISQDNLKMPEGPCILSPDKLFFSFKREIIMKNPDVYKIAALRDIWNLFPRNSSPIVAGFGNAVTDAIAYRAVGVSLNKIFIINPKAEIICLGNDVKWSYLKLLQYIDSVFPN